MIAESGDPRATAFVGRERELAALEECLRDAVAGRGRLLLLAGEPGIGKTRTAEELAQRAHAVDADVLVGRCREGEAAAASWPWIEIIRGYARSRDAASIRAEMGAGAASIASAFPAVRDLLPDLAPPPDMEPEQARLRLFDGIATGLANAAARKPLVIILDDVHQADRQSLLLVQFLVARIGATRILVVGTYRDTDLPPDHAFSQTLGVVAREPVTRTLVLDRLGERDVARYVELTTGAPAPAALVASVHRRSEGNPFFMTELLRLALRREGAGRDLAIPPGVRAVIRQRVGTLGTECNLVLQAASVIGREFATNLLQRVVDLPPPAVLRALDDAVADRVVVDVPDAIGRYRFAHSLIRETIHDELDLGRRIELHRAVGEALERLHGADVAAHVDDLAHHFLEAVRDGRGVEQAVRYARLAGQRAERQFAYEDAAAYYERALRVLDVGPSAHVDDRADLLLARAEAQRRVGDVASARATSRRAVALAREVGSGTLLARAALGVASGPEAVLPGIVDGEVVGVLEEALQCLDGDGSALRAMLLARLAAELHYARPHDRSVDLAREALAVARRSGDPSALAFTLNCAHFALWLPERLEERLAIADETIALAHRAGQHDLAFRGHVWRLTDVFELGDVCAVDAEIESCTRLAGLLNGPFYRWYPAMARTARALLTGHFEDAERQAAEAFALGQQAQSAWAEGAYLAQMFALRRDQGRLAELAPAMTAALESNPPHPIVRCTAALVCAELGQVDQAREHFETLAGRDFATLPRDAEWLLAMAWLSEVCAFLADARRAGTLHELLVPFADLNLVVGNGVVCGGPLARHLGLLAATAGRWHDAERYFEAASEAATRMGARPLVARTRFDHARMLLQKGAAGDQPRAAALLAQASETARELGMARLTEQLAATAAGTSLEGSSLEVQRILFVHEAGCWTIGSPGRVFRLRDSLGLRYLARLLREPERSLRATDLMAPTSTGGRSAAEHARLNVTRAIKLAVAHIAAADPALGRYLATTISTGRSCAYRPDVRFAVVWTF